MIELPDTAQSRILVVDDNPDIAKLLTFILGGMAEISCACTAAQGLDVARQVKPDLDPARCRTTRQ